MSGEPVGFDIASAIARLKENPELISGIASAFSSPAPRADGDSIETDNAPAAPTIDPEMLSKLLPAVSALSGGIGGKGGEKSAPQNPRCELLRALRPFLSPKRCEAIDYMIKMDGLSAILGNMKQE